MSASIPKHPFLSWSQQVSLKKLRAVLAKEAGLIIYDDENAIKLTIAAFGGSVDYMKAGEHVAVGAFQTDTDSYLFAEIRGKIDTKENGPFAMIQISRRWLERRFTSNGGFDAVAAGKFRNSLIAMLGVDPRKVQYERSIIQG